MSTLTDKEWMELLNLAAPKGIQEVIKFMYSNRSRAIDIVELHRIRKGSIQTAMNRFLRENGSWARLKTKFDGNYLEVRFCS